MSAEALATVRVVGSALPADVLSAVVAGVDGLGGLDADAYRLEFGVSPREAANRAWSVLTGAYAGYRAVLAGRPEGDPAVGLTREKWLAIVLRELGFGRVPATPAGGLTADDRQFAVSHVWDTDAGHVPVHLLGWGVELDRRTPGQAGAADRAPHAMVQEYLNRTDGALWGLVSNGRRLRLLRDSSTLIGQSFVEFDLEAMFDGEVFSDFVVMYLVCHATRFETRNPDGTFAEHPTAADCWLERWRTHAAETGTRALTGLRPAVAKAIAALGTGFARHPQNDLHRRLGVREITPDDVHHALLRLVYRLLFCFVAEDRGLLLDPDAPVEVRERYARWFSTARLRRVSTRRHGSGHSDIWQSLRLVLDGLGREGGRPELALAGLGGIFELGESDVVAQLELSNTALLEAVRHLTVVQPAGGGPKRRVDYRNLGAEELGSVYESLLEFVPRYDESQRAFSLESVVGNERKTSGAYYTPTSLIDCLLDSALDPLLDDAEKADDPERALLELTVCDPACGSGHFLVAAAKRIAARLATVRARAEGAEEPTVLDEQAAMRDVVDRCIYGVDLNPLAAELAKVSLWLESIQPGRALSFLNAHIKVGNALIGATPATLAGGIPDDAYKALGDEDKKWVASLRNRNRAERDAGQDDLFTHVGIGVANDNLGSAVRTLERLPRSTLEDVHVAARRYREFDDSPDLTTARRVADAWSAAFVAEKSSDVPAITHSTLLRLLQGESRPTDDLAGVGADTDLVAQVSGRYRFFHWHLEFPQIFEVNADTADAAGWTGGFSCIIGNPPWDTLSPDTREFFGGLVPEIRTLSKAEKNERIEELLANPAYRQRWEQHQRELFAIAHFLKQSGRYRMYAPGNLGKGDFNVYRSFAELALTMTRPGGYAGQVIQSGLYAGANASAIRRALIEECTWTSVYGFDNKGGSWFEGVTLENFAAYAARVGQPPPGDHEIEAAFGLPSPTSLPTDLASRRLHFAIEDIVAQNPETLAIPDIRDPRGARVTKKINRAWPPFGSEVDGLPLREFSREIDMSDKNNVFSEDPVGLPVYEGRMIDFYDHRAKRYLSGHGNSSKWEATPFGHPLKSIWPQWHVPETGLATDHVRERTRRFRVGFMDVADPGRQRSFVSALVPPGSVCGHKVPTLRIPDAEWYIPTYLAIANSLVIDFIVRQRVMSKSMAFNIIDGLPIARLERADERSAWLARRSLLLTCTSQEMTPFWNQMAGEGWVEEVAPEVVPGECDPDRRASIRAEIDAFVAQSLYGLTEAELTIILDSFIQLEGIELKRHGEYRTKRMVLDAYRRLLPNDDSRVGTSADSPRT